MKDIKPINLLCAGECMLELRSENNHFISSYAGDVTNFCIYLKRLSPSASVKFFSAIGEDPLSQKMGAFLLQEAIDTQLIFVSPDKTIGLYIVHTDDLGERTFSYWRSDSAAKRMFSIADTEQLHQVTQSIDYFYFSGITLAILNQQNREKLLAFVSSLRKKGKTIIFDPNFRTKLWQNIEEARAQIAQAYSLTNILLSSCDDEQMLFGRYSLDNTLEHLQSFNIDEIILTNGPNEIVGIYQGNRINVTPEKAKQVVDTTSAGDAFNAGYIAARHAGIKPKIAIKHASMLASQVIGFRGAIIPKGVALHTPGIV